MRSRRGASPKKELPVPEAPTCQVCGSRHVTSGSVEDGVPLCIEHDTEIARERIDLERGIESAAESCHHIEMQLVQARDQHGQEDFVARKRKQKRRHKERLQERKEKLRELQERCDHEQMDEWHDEYDEGDLERVPESEMPESLPIVEIHRRCPECGHEEQEVNPA